MSQNICKINLKSDMAITSDDLFDVLPDEQIYWDKTEQVIKNLADTYGFGRLETPILERKDFFDNRTENFLRDFDKKLCGIDGKKGGEFILRPDFAPVITRAFVESELISCPMPIKLYSIGSLFRYNDEGDRTLKHLRRANFEVFGEKDAVMDAQLVQLFFSAGKEFGLKKLLVQINSTGCKKCRGNYFRQLINFYSTRKNKLCERCSKRYQEAPLALLRCKKQKCLELRESAPQMIDFLCEECRNHFKNVLEFFDELGIPYFLNTRLMGEYEYYTKTAFQIFWEKDSDNIINLACGCRHDDLIESISGSPMPATGFYINLDKIIELMKEGDIKIASKKKPLIFLVQLGDLGKKKSLILFEDLRRSGLRVANTVSQNTIRPQIKTAQKMDARFVLIMGQREALAGTVILRDSLSGLQEFIPVSKVIPEIKKRLKKDKLLV